jgi:hypothetical protein
MKKQKFSVVEKAWKELFPQMIWRHVTRAGSLSSVIPTIPLFEGSSFGYVTEEKNKADELLTVSAGFSIEHDVIRDTDLYTFKKVLLDFVNEIIGSVEQEAIRSIGDQISNAGQSIDNQGKPFTWGSLITLLEKIDWEFGPQGEWLPPTMVLSPELLPRVRQVLAEADEDTEKVEYFRALRARKKAEFDDREANRKLVD